MNITTRIDRTRIGSLAIATFVALIAAAAAATPLEAVPGASRRDYDALQSQPRVDALPELTSPRAPLSFGRRPQVEERLGVPTFLWLNGTTVSRETRGNAIDAIATARAVAREVARLYGMSHADIDSAVAREAHDTGAGPRIVTFAREIEGIEVWRDRMSVLLDRHGQAVAVSGYLAPARLGSGASKRFALAPEHAVAIAATDATGLPFDPAAFRDAGGDSGRYRHFDVRDANSTVRSGIRVKRVLYHMPDRLLAAYYLEIEVADDARSSGLWGYVVSAEDGALLHRTSLTQYESFSYRVWADTPSPYIPFAGPTADFLPHPTGEPDGSFPPYVAPNLVTLECSPFSRNDPWLPPGASESAGNNVDAYADISGNDGFDASDIRATTTAMNTFDRTYDTAAAPNASASQRMASIAQIFYTVNFLHDWFYDSGFDEAAGNAQADNFGRGGLGGDPIRAEAQDSDGRVLNNADMSTPADGGSPRMQVYIFSGRAEADLVLAPGGPVPHVRANFGPTTFHVAASVALALDHTPPSNDVCDSIANDVNGKIALITRGTCTFESKALRAQQAGAVGVIIANNEAELPPAMGDDPDTSGVTIPIVMIGQDDGEALGAALASGPVSAEIFRFENTKLDGTIENSIVAHEWGHFLTRRLAELGSQQSHSMAEGWSDFVALLMSVREGDDPDGVYPIAQYATQGISVDSGYFGIRRYPYSTDLAANPLTFKHITDGVELPTGAPVAQNFLPNSENHNAGEVWAQALWECYAALLDDSTRSSFAEAQRRMKEYLVASLKLTPPAPTFTEARDAMLATAYAGDIADYHLFCAAFSRRGLGVGAVSPDRASANHEGVVESFACGGDLIFVGATLVEAASCDLDGVVDRGESGTLTLSFQNSGNVPLENSSLQVTSRNPNVSFPAGASLAIPSSNPYDVVTASVQVLLLPGATGFQAMSFDLSWDDPELLASRPRLASSTFEGNFDLQSNASTRDDVEAHISAWSQGGSPARSGSWERVAASIDQHYWHAANTDARSDSSLVSPPLQVATSGNLVIAFDHRFTFEVDTVNRWDGGVIEISTDDAATWVDVGSEAVPGYNGTISGAGGNPLANRPAFTGPSLGYPEFVRTTVDLGEAYAGKTIRFRFRLGAGDLGAAPGWDVDDIVVSGITNAPFTSRLPQAACSGLSIADVSVAEPVTGTASATFTVSLASASASSFTVDYATAGASATAGADFTSTAGTLTFSPGETSKSIVVPILADDVDEPSEIFFVDLIAASPPAKIVHGRAVGTIRPHSSCPSRSLCMQGDRFELSLSARDHRTGATAAGVPQQKSGQFGFFTLPTLTGSVDNPEVFVKLLDGRPINGNFWFFHGGLTDLEYTVSVLDTSNGATTSYTKPPGSSAGGFDVGGGVTPESCAGEVDGSAATPVPPAACVPGVDGLCLNEGRFRIELSARDQRSGQTAIGLSIPENDRFGYFALPDLTGDATNPEVFVKVLDGRPVNGHFWVFFAGLTDLEYTVTVTDTATGIAKTYVKNAGSACGAFDTNGF